MLRVVDGLAFYLLGLIVMLATGERRGRLGDLAAGTIVADASSAKAAPEPDLAAAKPATAEPVAPRPTVTLPPPPVPTPVPELRPFEPEPAAEPPVVAEPEPEPVGGGGARAGAARGREARAGAARGRGARARRRGRGAAPCPRSLPPPSRNSPATWPRPPPAGLRRSPSRTSLPRTSPPRTRLWSSSLSRPSRPSIWSWAAATRTRTPRPRPTLRRPDLDGAGRRPPIARFASPLATIGTSGNPLRVAIVGSGPAGFYAAGHLQKSKSHPDLEVQVDVYDRLPTPWGLVRAGVAPDHPNIKAVSRVYEKTAEHPEFRFYGNVEIGRDLTHDELLAATTR